MTGSSLFGTPDTMSTYCQRQIMLTPKGIGYVGSYSRSMTRVEEMPSRFDGMLLHFTTKVLAGKTVTEKQRASVKVPASWWQSLKLAATEWHTEWMRKPSPPWLALVLPLDLLTIVPRVYLIPWFVRRHPVKYTTLTVEVRFSREMLYPGADVDLPPSEFGSPVMWETIQFDPRGPAVGAWALEDYGPPRRFMDRREVAREIMQDRDLAMNEGFGYGLHPGIVFGILDWFGRHGVNPDQLVARDAVR